MAALDSLRRAFLDDHKRLTQGLHGMLDSLRAGDWHNARRQARDLDHTVGPHMAFEEQVYYPRLRRILGSDFVNQLYHEHSEGVDAVRALVSQPVDAPFSQADRRRIVSQLETAFEHAKSCGTLMSHLANLGADEHAEMLDKLKEMRQTTLRWTEIEHNIPSEG